MDVGPGYVLLDAHLVHAGLLGSAVGTGPQGFDTTFQPADSYICVDYWVFQVDYTSEIEVFYMLFGDGIVKIGKKSGKRQAK